MLIARLDESQSGIKIARRNISSLIYADDTTLMAESEFLCSYLNIEDGRKGNFFGMWCFIISRKVKT